jgi:hypothetical protein
MEYQPLIRLYFINPESEICLSNIVDVVNENYHNTTNFIEDGCVSSVGLNEWVREVGAVVIPNPMSESAVLHFDNPWRSPHSLEIRDLAGRKLRTYADLRDTSFEFNRDALPSGTYFFKLVGKNNSTGRFVIR